MARAAALEGSAVSLCHCVDFHVTLLVFMQGRKVPGAHLTQNVLAAKQLAEHANAIASDSEEDSDSGLTELEVCCIRHVTANRGLNVAHQICYIVASQKMHVQAKKQRTSKSSTQAATQAPGGPLAHAESSRQESGKVLCFSGRASCLISMLFSQMFSPACCIADCTRSK